MIICMTMEKAIHRFKPGLTRLSQRIICGTIRMAGRLG